MSNKLKSSTVRISFHVTELRAIKFALQQDLENVQAILRQDKHNTDLSFEHFVLCQLIDKIGAKLN